MTNKQIKLLNTINDFIEKHGYAPTIRELCSILNVSSPATINDKLKRLRKNGIITYEDGKSRTIKILDRKWLA